MAEDLFDEARSSFVGVKDVDGRAIIVIPTGRGTANGDDGGEYEYVTGDVIVLDGPVTEMIETVPCVVADMRLSATNFVNQLRGKVAAGRPVLGRVNSQKGKFGNRAYGLGEIPADDPIRGIAREQIGAYRAARTAADPWAADA